MIKTNTKEVRRAMEAHLLEYYAETGAEGMKRDGEAINKNTRTEGVRYWEGHRLAEGGAFICYGGQAAEFLKKTLQETEAEAGKYSAEKTWNLYLHLCASAYERIIKRLENNKK